MRPDRVTLAAFVTFVLIGGAVSVAIRLGSFELPPLWAATLRYAGATVAFSAIAIALRIPFPRGVHLLGATLMSLTFVVSTALFYVGVSTTSASMGAIAFALMPLATLALAATIGIERFTFRGAAGALVAAVGAVVIVGDQLGAAVPLSGLLALGGAMVFGAATSVVIKRLPPGSPISANAAAGLVVTPLIFGLTLVTGESLALPNRPETWAALAFLILAGSVVLFPLALFIINRWTASGYSYTGLLEPLAAVALAAIILGEPIRLTFVIGGAIVLMGVWVGALSSSAVPSPVSAVIEAELTAPVSVVVDEGVAT